MIETSVNIIFPAGTYYVGDPCYVTPDEVWDDLLEKTNFFEVTHVSVDGHKMFADGTAHGDGEYRGSNGEYYAVDAGLIGVVPLALVKRWYQQYPESRHWKDTAWEDVVSEMKRLGSIEEYTHGFVPMCEEKGVFEFGRFTIDTDSENEEWDEEEDEEFYV